MTHEKIRLNFKNILPFFLHYRCISLRINLIDVNIISEIMKYFYLTFINFIKFYLFYF
jgi:hypothetical protein